uniref:hypothetical protein n=1 Tax=Stenotrophomonas maltophilia TaxID=40324 RepID=UPI00296FDCBB
MASVVAAGGRPGLGFLGAPPAPPHHHTNQSKQNTHAPGPTTNTLTHPSDSKKKKNPAKMILK